MENISRCHLRKNKGKRKRGKCTRKGNKGERIGESKREVSAK
jgi:hypothetical protein